MPDETRLVEPWKAPGPVVAEQTFGLQVRERVLLKLGVPVAGRRFWWEAVGETHLARVVAERPPQASALTASSRPLEVRWAATKSAQRLHPTCRRLLSFRPRRPNRCPSACRASLLGA